MNRTDIDEAAIVKELKSLRERAGLAGLAYDKLRKAPHLLAALALLDGQPSIGLRRGYELLIRELHALGDGDQARAARNALAIDMPVPGNVGQRRHDFARTAGRDSADTIENWENRAFEELALRLLSTAESPLIVDSAPLVDDQMTRATYTLERIERLSRYRGTVLQDVLVTREVRALVDGLDAVTALFRPGDGVHPKEIGVERYRSCLVDRVDYHDNGSIETAFRFPHPLRRGESHTFSYRYLSESTHPADPKIVLWPSLRNPARTAAIRAQFEPDAAPHQIWRIDGLSQLRMPGSARLCPPLTPDGSGYVETGFTNPHSGLGYGLGWRWR